MNRGKAAVPTIINDFDVIHSLPDKAKSFSASNTTLEDKDHLVPDFQRLTEHNPINITITVREFSKLIKSFDLEKATGS